MLAEIRRQEFSEILLCEESGFGLPNVGLASYSLLCTNKRPKPDREIDS